jgi:hypothetical protein
MSLPIRPRQSIFRENIAPLSKLAQRSLDSYVGDAVRKGTVSVWWAYREAHADNLAQVAKAWKDRPLPDLGSKP